MAEQCQTKTVPTLICSQTRINLNLICSQIMWDVYKFDDISEIQDKKQTNTVTYRKKLGVNGMYIAIDLMP